MPCTAYKNNMTGIVILWLVAVSAQRLYQMEVQQDAFLVHLVIQIAYYYTRPLSCLRVAKSLPPLF